MPIVGNDTSRGTSPRTHTGDAAGQRAADVGQTVPCQREKTARRRPRRPVFVSLYAPSGRRRWWWYAYRCPSCSTYQLGRASDLDRVTGARKAGCGHQVEIMVARVYRSPEAP